MRLVENLHQLASSYEYALDWLNTEVLSFREEDLEEVNQAREYLKNKIKFRDDQIKLRGEDRALKKEIKDYYRLVSIEVTDPITYLLLLDKGGDSNLKIEQIGGLVDKLSEHRFVKLEDMNIETYIDLVTARRDISERVLEVKNQSTRWFEQIIEYEKEVLGSIIKDRIEGMEGISPYNLYKLMYWGGQAGRFSWVGNYRKGSLFTFWLHQNGLESSPGTEPLEDRYSLYKTLYKVYGRDNVKTTKKEVSLSKRFLKMIEKEIVEGEIQKEEVSIVKGEHNIEAYGIGDYTLVFLGEMTLYKIEKGTYKEIKVAEKPFTGVLVRDLKKVMSKIKEEI